jgi:hypothetical protein
MSKYTHFTKLKHLIFLNGGSIFLHTVTGTYVARPVVTLYIPPQIDFRCLRFLDID